MKTNKILGGILLASLGLTSCSEEVFNAMESDGLVRLQASLEGTSMTRIGESWTGTEHIGFFMVKESGFEVAEGVSNKEYSVAKGAQGVLTGVDGEAAYPADGSKVQFVAYYPYSNSIANNLYTVNLSEEGIDHDLLYTRTAKSYDKTQSAAVDMSFAHQLAKLILNVKVEIEGAEEDIVLDNTNWSAAAYRSTTADFNLANGTFGNEGTQKYYNMDLSGATASALVIPGQEGKVTLSYDGKEYNWNTAEVNFESGVQYTYSITIKPSTPVIPDPAVEVKLESSIIDWDKITGDDIILDESEDNGGEGGNGGESGGEDTTPVYTSNVDLAKLTATTSATKSTVVIEGANYTGIKFGSSSVIGKCTTPIIGADVTKLSLYALAWTGKDSELKLTINDGGSINGASSATITATPHSGVSGSTSTYTVAVTNDNLYEFVLENTTENTTITIETTGIGEKRALIFGVNVE